MNTFPKVSVIIPVYNASKYIDKCISSVVNQSYPNIEIIVIDDGSTDSSLDIANKYKSNAVKIISQTNKGAAAARNAGLQIATGEYIQFLDADDILEKQKIEIQIGVLQKYNYPSNVVASCGWKHLKDTVYEVNDNQKKVWHTYQKPIEILKDFATVPCCLPHSVYLTPLKLIHEIGGWNEKLSKNDDGEFFARILEKTEKLIFCPNSYSFYRSTPNSLSKQTSSKVALSQIQSQLIMADIMEKELGEPAHDAICKMLTSSLCSIYPYYRKTRKIGEAYLKQHYPNYDMKYPSLNYKEWIYYMLKRFHLHA